MMNMSHRSLDIVGNDDDDRDREREAEKKEKEREKRKKIVQRLDRWL